MQVDGYSLDKQKDKLKKYAEFQDMMVADEYSDEGKSGKINSSLHSQRCDLLRKKDRRYLKGRVLVRFKLQLGINTF